MPEHDDTLKDLMKSGLTEAEAKAFLLLANAASMILALPMLHPMEQVESCHDIHHLQMRILARPGLRTLGWPTPEWEKEYAAKAEIRPKLPDSDTVYRFAMKQIKEGRREWVNGPYGPACSEPVYSCKKCCAFFDKDRDINSPVCPKCGFEGVLVE